MLVQACRQQLNHHAVREEWSQVVELCQQIILSGEADLLGADFYSLMGKALAYKGKEYEAIAAYSSSLALQPHHIKSHIALGTLYALQEKNAQAICHYQLALQISPNNAVAALRLGRLFHRLGSASEAAAAYRTAVKHSPDYAEAHYSLGLLQEQTGDDSAAIKNYRQAIFSDRTYTDAYRRLGVVLARKQAHSVVLSVYEQAVEHGAADAELYNSLGQIYRAQENAEAEVQAYRQALKLDAGSVIAHQNLGRLYQRHQSVAQSIQHFRQAYELAPNRLPPLSDYTWALMRKGQWEAVLDCFRRACLEGTDFITAYCERTIALPGRDLLFKLQNTCGLFLLALQQSNEPPDKPEATTENLKHTLAQVFERAADLSLAGGAFDRAEQCYRFALSLQPGNLRLYRCLGECVGKRSPHAEAAVYQAGLLQAQRVSGSGKDRETDSLSEQLEQQLQQALLLQSPAQREIQASKEISTLLSESETYPICGVYRYVQDWLADNNLLSNNLSEDGSSPPKKRAESPIASAQTASSDPQCGGLTCQRCMTNLVRTFSPTQVSKRAFRCTDNRSASHPKENPLVSDFPTFLVTIPRGRVWIAPQQSAWKVCDEIAVFSPDGFLLGDISRYYPWYLPGCDRHDIVNHPVLKRRSGDETALPTVQQLSGRVAVLAGLSAHVYYHWLFDVLPRLEILKTELRSQNLTLNDVDYFVVNNTEKSFQRETLAALGVPTEKVIASDRTPHIQADQLLVPSFAGHLDWVPPRSLAFLRAAFLSENWSSNWSGNLSARLFEKTNKEGGYFVGEKGEERTGKRLYITRSQAKYRQVLNEDAVVDFLKRFGFVVVALESLTVAEQSCLFSAASIIVGAHGSGLANLAFCSPGTTVVEFFSPNYLRTDYWMISEALGLNHYYLTGESFAFAPLRQLMYPSGLTEDILIDMTALKRLMQHIDLRG